MQHYYQILGVEMGASLDEIRVAFRRLAKRYHPDTKSPHASAEKFDEIVRAYDAIWNLHNNEKKFSNFSRKNNEAPKATYPKAEWDFKSDEDGHLFEKKTKINPEFNFGAAHLKRKRTMDEAFKQFEAYATAHARKSK